MAFSSKQHPITSAWLREFRAEFPDLEIYYRSEGGETHGEPSEGAYVLPVIEQRKK
jgi:ABC-type phosphate transport system substrate-binding protein